MGDQTTDMWPKEISPGVKSPAAIMKVQASILGQRTNGLLLAKVITEQDKPNVTRHEFQVIAPSLDYAYSLFTATHDPTFVYPVEITFRPWVEKAKREHREKLYGSPDQRGLILATRAVAVAMGGGPSPEPSGTHRASSEADFAECLKEILTSAFTRSVVMSLLAKLNDENELQAVSPSTPAAGPGNPADGGPGAASPAAG